MGPPGRAIVATAGLLPADEAALRRAIDELRRSSLAMRLTALIGRQLGAISLAVPSQFTEAVNKSAEAAIRSAMAVALRSLATAEKRDRRRLHRSVATLAGAAGGAIGLAGLPFELPFTTTVMLRSIADIALSEGEDLSDPDVAIACLEVFALGSEQQHPADSIESGSALDTGYFAVRVLLAKSITQSAKRFLQSGLTDQAAPLLVRLITQISARFGLVVSQKLAAQSIPIIGAASGAAINYAFVDHFQTLARGHFTVRRLERIYGAAQVRVEYDRLAAQI
ncbi:peptidase [Methylocella silvestris]|uniref:Peptidase n=2 Tax=Methylocella silvestris TaxID=199596 RepID=A0A2J7TJL1_METSI|nr:peptidase [Methylocella silvestris]